MTGECLALELRPELLNSALDSQTITLPKTPQCKLGKEKPLMTSVFIRPCVKDAKKRNLLARIFQLPHHLKCYVCSVALTDNAIGSALLHSLDGAYIPRCGAAILLLGKLELRVFVKLCLQAINRLVAAQFIGQE